MSMEIEVIKELIDAFKSSDLTRLKLQTEGIDLELEREKQVPNMVATPMTSQSVVTPQTALAEVHINTNEVEEESAKVIKSPMVGTFYTASSPGQEPFVKVGDKVKKGDVVCIVEAMKLMNEVESDQEGEIVEILVQNEEMVEFGQPLFKLKA